MTTISICDADKIRLDHPPHYQLYYVLVMISYPTMELCLFVGEPLPAPILLKIVMI